MRKIKMLANASGPDLQHYAGRTYSVEDKRAEEWVKGNYAQYADGPKAKSPAKKAAASAKKE